MLIQGFRDVTITRSGMRTDCEGGIYWGACFKLDGEVEVLFPYINAVLNDACYKLRPLSIQFKHEGVRCTLYPADAVAAPFGERDQVFSFIEKLVVFLNEIYDCRSELTPNHKIQSQPASIVEILKALPRTNCRKCGYPTCLAFAAALRAGGASTDDCPDFIEPLSTSSVYPVFGPDGRLRSTFTLETDRSAAQNPALTTAADSQTQGGEAPQTPHDLTPREVQVLKLVAEGASNPEISARLRISPHTVKSHIIHIFNKLGVNDRTQAAVWAVTHKAL
jgi:DNA-binding CsgD family transcriptional regulator/ArsR family metal-binding transcriptional regulator